MEVNINTIDKEKVLIINNIIKRIKDDFTIDDNFDLLKLIQGYSLDFILNDLSLFIKNNYKG